ncbi:hypothetical protein FQN60_007691 [Etheostoma spectabile]|uniref:Uncharacterized protein n=1 Tax=Etheostoma spectabile TaxID=54343 RepID=A0A5J5CUN6_9PERO|nr:hypothetical protein FQN60_007691 [Etheostoma spectabile]
MAAAGPVTSSGTVLEKEACMQHIISHTVALLLMPEIGSLMEQLVAVANSSPPPLPRVPL